MDKIAISYYSIGPQVIGGKLYKHDQAIPASVGIDFDFAEKAGLIRAVREPLVISGHAVQKDVELENIIKAIEPESVKNFVEEVKGAKKRKNNRRQS